MGNFNMDVVTTSRTTGDIDIEAQLCNPKWFVDHKHMLRPNQEGEGNELGYAILKVPEYWRQPQTAFSPVGWRFGLHNRENLDSCGSEAIKLGVAVQYGLVGEKWDDFCDAIVDNPKAMLACYGLQNGVTNWSDEQIKHVLALDALFLATHIDLSFPRNERRLWTSNTVSSPFNASDVFHTRYDMWVRSVTLDLCRVENQIPFVLIHKVVQYMGNRDAFQTLKDKKILIVDLQYQQRSIQFMAHTILSSFIATSSEVFEIDKSSPIGDKTHILGVAYNVICGPKDILVNQKVYRDEYIRVPSATKLKQSSIKIVGVDGPLNTMTYTKKCLFLPKMRIYDETFTFIRNMAWYENSSISDGCLFHDYIFFMSDLIQAPEDLDLLIKCGVIYNSCGIKGFEMWIALKEGLAEISSSKRHHDMKVAIVSRCGLRRYRLWSEFKIVFCSKPWVVLSTSAIILVTMATLVQTYIAIIGSNKMEPKFP